MPLGQRLAVPGGGEGDGEDDDREEQEVDGPVQAQGLDVAVVGLDGSGVLGGVADPVDGVVGQE